MNPELSMPQSALPNLPASVGIMKGSSVRKNPSLKVSLSNTKPKKCPLPQMRQRLIVLIKLFTTVRTGNLPFAITASIRDPLSHGRLSSSQTDQAYTELS